MDALIAAAAAKVSNHGVHDLLVGGSRIGLEQRRRLHDLPGLAVAALRHAEIAPGNLNRMLALRVEAFDGDDSFAADVAHLVADAPPDWRGRLVEGLDEPDFRVTLTRGHSLVSESAASGGGWRTAMIRHYVESRLAVPVAGPVLVRLLDMPDADGPPVARGMAARMRTMMMVGTPFRRLQVSIRLADGAWLNVDGAMPEPPSLWSTEAAVSMLLMVVAVILFSILVVRRVTRPLSLFARAAERLGLDVAAPPLAEAGPLEVRCAVRAFNDMQERLRRLVENRTRMLAAISHDLRTPITLLRLRAELIEDDDDRRKTLATLDQMEGMIASTLAFAREDAVTEARKVVDLAALVDTVCADMADAGADVTCAAGPDHLAYRCAPVALRRALTNLVDNAVKYGGRARLILSADDHSVAIDIEDDGPGIPADRQGDVFAPFVRLEESRSPETGGVGLGLSIAQSVVHAHGGEIRLQNRPEGGLRVSLRLPR